MDVPRAQVFHPPMSREREMTGEMPVDLAHLRRYTLGDEALEAEVLELFLAQLPETIAALRSATTEREWKAAAHTLKGSSRAVGAWQIATLAQEAETLACGSEPEACLQAISRLEIAALEASIFVKSAAHKA